MSIAIMQPYVFPYVGYFQLVNAVDVFVFYDDVHFIKQGWIHRNTILSGNQPQLFSIPLQKQSSNKLINETKINNELISRWRNKFLKTLEQAYNKAPYFSEINNLIYDVFETEYNSIAELSISSVQNVAKYLNMDTTFQVSSQLYEDSKGIDKEERIIDICKKSKNSEYINAIGGRELYTKTSFKKKGVDLSFLKTTLTPYKQWDNTFTPGLSIIDVLMFNSIIETKELLQEYSLI